ncbi:MAG: hypothetical protein HY063_13635 [Bacteroidetes bacterium]|nr:hypothetical protein [Bacteroidota bacterium]
MKLKFSFLHIGIYLLILSLFQGSFIIQYSALFIFILIFLFTQQPVIKKNIFLFIPVLLILVAFISYIYNYINESADGYTFLFWIFSYLPPIILMWIIISCAERIDFFNAYKFYKWLVYFQSFLLIISAIQNHKFIVGDPAKGTVGDANWVAFHICVVLLYEIVRIIILSKQGKISFTKNFSSFAEILYFLVVLLIPESTANLGFMIIIIGFIFFNEYLLRYVNFFRIVLFILISICIIFFVSKTYVYERLEDAVVKLQKTEIEKNPYLSKVKIYKNLFSGELYSQTNWLLGSGPATFTSRSSVMRMPDERVNEFPIELPYFKSELFKKYISPIYANWRKTREQYGNFASPQTTIISVSVELGLAGIFIFILLFYFIYRNNKIKHYSNEFLNLKKFVLYVTLFYFTNLFYLNFWEYPIITFTYIVFIFSILYNENLSTTRIVYEH